MFAKSCEDRLLGWDIEPDILVLLKVAVDHRLFLVVGQKNSQNRFGRTFVVGTIKRE